MQKMKSKKNIIVLGTGGTIAGVGQEGVTGDYKSAQIEINTLVEDIPYMNSLANIKSVDMFNVDSCDISFENLRNIAKYINENALNDEIDGFVITHGTDTLEESAYFLNLTVKTKKPVVLTGSMRPGTAISADGPLNLYQAVALASNEISYGQGVLVTFCDGIYGARDISKINTFRTYAFDQRDLGCLGYMKDEKAYFYNSPVKKHTFETPFDISLIGKLPKVEIFYFYIDSDIEFLDFVSKHCDGLVIAGAGCGGVSSLLSKKIESLLAEGLPIVRSSRIGNGLVTFNKDELKTKGIYANNLNPQKSRILLSLALTVTKNQGEIQEFFNEY